MNSTEYIFCHTFNISTLSQSTLKCLCYAVRREAHHTHTAVPALCTNLIHTTHVSWAECVTCPPQNHRKRLKSGPISDNPILRKATQLKHIHLLDKGPVPFQTEQPHFRVWLQAKQIIGYLAFTSPNAVLLSDISLQSSPNRVASWFFRPPVNNMLGGSNDKEETLLL